MPSSLAWASCIRATHKAVAYVWVLCEPLSLLTHRRLFLLVAGIGGLLYAGFLQNPTVSFLGGAVEDAPGWQTTDAVVQGAQSGRAQADNAGFRESNPLQGGQRPKLNLAHPLVGWHREELRAAIPKSKTF